jgi:hypothetical protein
MRSSVGRQGATNAHFPREVASVVTSDIPFVAFMRLDEFSLRGHDGCSCVLPRIASNERRSSGKIAGTSLAGRVAEDEDSESTQMRISSLTARRNYGFSGLVKTVTAQAGL